MSRKNGGNDLDKLKVAVTGVGGNIGYGIIRALKLCSIDVTIVAFDAEPSAIGLYQSDEAYLLPRIHNEERCLTEVITICRQIGVDVILVGSDIELPFYSRYREKIESQTRAKVLLNSSKVIRIGCDKWLTYQFLKDKGLPYCRSTIPYSRDIDGVLDFANELGYPLVVKPRFGSGAKNFHIVYDKEALLFYVKRTQDCIIQEYLKGDNGEYTSSVFSDKNGVIKGIFVSKRILRKGDSYVIYCGKFPEVEEQVKKVVTELGSIGVCNVQLLFGKEKGPIVFEINPRFSGTSVIRALYGFNEIEFMIRHFVFGEDISNFSLKKGISIRYLSEVMIDYSQYDTLVKRRHL